MQRGAQLFAAMVLLLPIKALRERLVGIDSCALYSTTLALSG